MTQTHPGDVLAPQKTAPAAPPVDHSPNPEVELARRFVTETNQHVFLTGRAGTGKTTFLHGLRQSLQKSYVVVAPTGVAAINAKGTTIHSQMQLPFGLITPELMRSGAGQRRLAKKREQVLRRIDLLIIDEVSMVRADVMDAIDFVLKRVRHNSAPFGGVQLLLIGDLHQLPPVVKRDEERAMAELYPTPYFFSANALQKAGLVTVELERVYRQTDTDFVQLLGEVRANRMTPDVLRKLNSRYRDTDLDADQELSGYVTLTSHRRAADDINAARLAATPGDTSYYRANVTGNFPESSYPTDATLELKVGAQVMFVKNDRDGLYHNGKIGTVVALEDAQVTVDCGADGGRLTVGQVRWENANYSLDERTQEVSEEVAGSFSQVPLRLAWAITIHKSQGLTFDRVIIDAAAAFAHGQVYVALSRCRTFEGIILRSEIASEAVRTDREVNHYTEVQREHRPGEAQLTEARRQYRGQLIREAFEFGGLARAAEAFRRHGLVEGRSYPGLEAEELDGIVDAIRNKCGAVAARFGQQLGSSLQETDLAADPPPVPSRCREAVAYFRTQLEAIAEELIGGLDLETDNADVRERGEELLADLSRELKLSRSNLDLLAQETFEPNAILAARAKISLGQESRSGGGSGSGGGPVKAKNPLLYQMLSDWRTATGKRLALPVGDVLSARVMRALSAARPVTVKQLTAVAGLGSVTASRYGKELLEVVARHAEMEAKGQLAPKPGTGGSAGGSINSTSSLTLSMFRQGQSVEEIMATRSFALSTICTHLAAAVEAGMTDAAGVISDGHYEKIAAFCQDNDGDTTGAHAFFGGEIDHGHIKLGRAIWIKDQAATSVAGAS